MGNQSLLLSFQYTAQGIATLGRLINFTHCLPIFFLKILFIYLRDRDRDSKGEYEWGAEGQAGSPQRGEPEAGMDPRTPES